MRQNPSKPWFAPKPYGYGSGLPIAWQGWAVLAAYVVTCCGTALILPLIIPKPAIFFPLAGVVVLIATVVLCVICMAKTEGGWRWRWGKKP